MLSVRHAEDLSGILHGRFLRPRLVWGFMMASESCRMIAALAAEAAMADIAGSLASKLHQ